MDFNYLPPKQRAEAQFWEGVIERYVLWYRGELKELFDRPAPSNEIKVTGVGMRENAIRTWIKVASSKYLQALRVGPEYFSGCRVLDVGCGPIPHLHCFRSAERYGIDQLIREYRAIGFPLDSYDPPVSYLIGCAEAIPVRSNFFDAVVSVNALDHVDDLGMAAGEIARVLRTGGCLRLQLHYHEARTCEPWALNDEIVMAHFGRLGIKKVHEEPVADAPGEKFVVWSTRAG